MNENEVKKNGSGYSDPTAYEAIKHVDPKGHKHDESEGDRFHKLLETIFKICELSDFHVEDRIVVKDKRTGKVWR